MEGLVNYSSEDEQDMPNYKTAERGNGSNLRRTPSYYDSESKRRRGNESKNGNNNGSPYPSGNSTGGGVSSFKEDYQEKYASPKTQLHSGNRSSSSSNQTHYKRDSSRGGDGEKRESRGDGERRESRGEGERRETRGVVEKRESRGLVERREIQGEGDSRESRREGEKRESRREEEKREYRGEEEKRESRGELERRESRRESDRRESRGEIEKREIPGEGGRRESGDADLKDNKDSREHKDSFTREHRDYGNRNNNNDSSNRSKDIQNRNYRRNDDNHRQERNSDVGRGHRGGSTTSRDRHTSPQHNNSKRHSDGGGQMERRHQNYSRSDRSYNRSERYDATKRKQRSPTARSRSPASASLTTIASSRSKRYNSGRHNDETHRARHRSHRSPRSRSRSRSPQHSLRMKSRSPRRSSSSFKPMEQARHTALDLERKLNASDSKSTAQEMFSRKMVSGATVTSSHKSSNTTEAVLTLPLSETAAKPPTVIALAANSHAAGSSEPAIIQLPSYYNPSVINPNKYAEQVQKRKLIWGAKKSEDTAAAKWGHAQFSQDSDGKVASKFMRLMGIKGNIAATAAKSDATAAETDQQTSSPTGVDFKSREKMFTSMEKQYEVARQVTHTMRGVGLGFSSQTRPF